MAGTVYECTKCSVDETARDDNDLMNRGWGWTDDGWLCPDCWAERKLL